MSSFNTDSTSLYRNDSIQSFMITLRKCDPDLCIESEFGYCYSNCFDPKTLTLTVPRLDCWSLTDEDFESFHVLEHVNGDLVICDNPHVTSLDGLRNLETVNGRFELINSGVRELNGLTRLRLVKLLSIEKMPELQSITGFTSLESCGTGLYVQGNKALERIDGFTSLSTIDDGSLIISDNPVLVSVLGMLTLNSIGGSMSITNCPELSDFRFLLFLEYVANLEVSNTKLSDGSSLRKLFRMNPHFKGSIKLTQNRLLTDLSFMEGLTTVGSSLYLHQNSLVNAKGLESLKRVGASFNLSANKLEDISQLSSLEEIDGILGLSYNQLQSLHGLENLCHIRTKKWGKELLSIKFNDNRRPDGSISLDDISALSNIKEMSGQIVMFTDSEHGHLYRVKPGVDSVFHTVNKNIQVYGRDSAAVLPLSHIVDEQDEIGTPVLFPDMSKAWQRALLRCEGIIPHFRPFRQVDDLVEYCQAQGIRIVVGIKLTSQKFLASHKEELRRHGLRFIVNDLETLDNCENKISFRRFMVKNGYGQFVPKYYEDRESIQYPSIVKPEYGSFGSGQRIIYSEEEMKDISSELVVSEYIAGKVEYASNIFFLDRQNYWNVTYKKTYNEPYFILGKEKKENLVQQTVDTPYLDLFLNILEELHYVGICCIDFKPVDNEPKIFEINARTGYTLASHSKDLRKMLDRYIACARKIR